MAIDLSTPLKVIQRINKVCEIMTVMSHKVFIENKHKAAIEMLLDKHKDGTISEDVRDRLIEVLFKVASDIYNSRMDTLI